MVRRYNEILFMIDTCQANGMYTKFYSPNILATGSSRVGENSYSVRPRMPNIFLSRLNDNSMKMTVTLESL